MHVVSSGGKATFIQVPCLRFLAQQHKMGQQRTCIAGRHVFRIFIKNKPGNNVYLTGTSVEGWRIIHHTAGDSSQLIVT